METDLLHPDPKMEARRHKLKRLVQGPNSYFIEIKCPGCNLTTTVFSHSHSIVMCGNCARVLCRPTGGRCHLMEGCSYRRLKE